MDKNWYEISIKELFESFLRERGYSVEFNTVNFFFDELERWTAKMGKREKEKFIKLAYKARNYAFNTKYGAYNYSNDYRSECPEWSSKFLSKILQYQRNLKMTEVLAVGSNNGSELYQIFGYDNGVNFDVVEISKDAIRSGEKAFPNIHFFCESMDVFEPINNNYDIYLNLRAAYCAGNDLDIVVKKAYGCLKIGGLAIFSISNGYINISNGIRKITKGIYNPTNKECSDKETGDNLGWVRTAMLQNGFSKIELFDVDSEILLISQKTMEVR